MRKFARLLCLLWLTAAAPASQAQEFDEIGRWVNGIGEPWHFDDNMTKAEIATAQSRWKLIAAEAAGAAQEWAGDYGNGGETHGSYLRWSPRGGFVVFHVDKCRAAVMGLDYGRAAVSESEVRFDSERAARPPAGRPHSHAHPTARAITKWLPVRWRGAHYLVPENSIGDFYDYVAGLGRHNAGAAMPFDSSDFFFKFGDKETGRADEPPVVPRGYERYAKRPIDAEITGVGRRVVKRRRDAVGQTYYQSETSVTLNVGRSSGLKPGTHFYVLGPGESETVEVRRVGVRSAVGVIARPVDEEPGVKMSAWRDYAGRDFPPVAAGWKLSTSPHKFLESVKHGSGN